MGLLLLVTTAIFYICHEMNNAVVIDENDESF